jgi:superfamily II DNA or RNA helicase
MELARQSYRAGHKYPCLVLPCGAGKSIIAADMAKSSIEKGNQVLFIVHRRELCAQIEQAFISYGVNMNMCTVGMVQTVCRRVDKIEPPDLIITDEAHHSTSASYTKIFNAFPGAHRIGLTATPGRLDGKGLKGVFDDIIAGVTAKWLIANHYLSPYRLFSVPLADVGKLKVARGEYVMGGLMDDKRVYGETVSTYRKIADGRKTIVYCPSVVSANETAMEFQNNGYSAVALSGETPKKERESAMGAFRRGDVLVLCNCDLFGEGVDVADCSCVVMLRKTKSLTLFIQQAMRSMRVDPNDPDKTAIIIDHVLNYSEHGLPDDDREWSLEGKKGGESAIKVKQCPQCFAVIENSKRACPECGYDFSEAVAASGRRAAELVETELKEIKDADGQRERYGRMKYADYRKLGTFDELEGFRKAKGYKFGWTIYKCLELGIGIPDKYSWQIGHARKQLGQAGRAL